MQVRPRKMQDVVAKHSTTKRCAEQMLYCISSTFCSARAGHILLVSYSFFLLFLFTEQQQPQCMSALEKDHIAGETSHKPLRPRYSDSGIPSAPEHYRPKIDFPQAIIKGAHKMSLWKAGFIFWKTTAIEQLFLASLSDFCLKKKHQYSITPQHRSDIKR